MGMFSTFHRVSSGVAAPDQTTDSVGSGNGAFQLFGKTCACVGIAALAAVMIVVWAALYSGLVTLARDTF